MKHRVPLILCVGLLCCLLLGGCNRGNDDVTVITKGSVSYSLHTTTTTTATTTTTNTTAATGYGAASTASGEQTVATTVPPVVGENGSTAQGNAIAQTAVSLIGTPFKTGASGPDAFDNPGFVVYCYKQAGYTVPNRAAAMQSYGAEAPLSALQPGDILLFCNDIGGAVQFAGIYIGDNRFVACNNPNSPTKVQQLNSAYWSARLLAARRAA